MRSNYFISILLFCLIFFISGCNQSKSIKLYETYSCPSDVTINDASECKSKCTKNEGYYSVHPDFPSGSVLLLSYDSNISVDALDGYVQTIENCKILDLTNIKCDYRYKVNNIKPSRIILTVNKNYLVNTYFVPGYKSISCAIN